jgi:hypothetical protein
MSYFTGVLIGIVVTVFVLATLLIMQARVAPQSLRVALEWLIQHTLTDSQATAVIRGRRGLPYPSHLRDNRILINGTDVWFDDNGEFRQATIDGYHREPGRGNYYLVKFLNVQRWVPDTYVWETARELRKAA